MRRKIELLALLDYIKMIIKYRKLGYLNTEPFETIFISYTDDPLVSELDHCLSNAHFDEALALIEQNEEKHQKTLKIYEALKQDYFSLEHMQSQEDIASIIQDKYGITHSEELVEILDLQAKFIAERQYS